MSLVAGVSWVDMQKGYHSQCGKGCGDLEDALWQPTTWGMCTQWCNCRHVSHKDDFLPSQIQNGHSKAGYEGFYTRLDFISHIDVWVCGHVERKKQTKKQRKRMHSQKPMQSVVWI